MVDPLTVLRRYESQETLQSIASSYGVSRQYINEVLRKLGAARRRKWSKSAPNPSEWFVSRKLKRLGITHSFTPYCADCDIILEDGKRVEVKYRHHAYRSQDSYRYFKIVIYDTDKFDFLIVVLGSLHKPTCYIVPSSGTPHYLSIPLNPVKKTSFQKNYHNAWHLLII